MLLCSISNSHVSIVSPSFSIDFGVRLKPRKVHYRYIGTTTTGEAQDGMCDTAGTRKASSTSLASALLPNLRGCVDASVCGSKTGVESELLLPDRMRRFFYCFSCCAHSSVWPVVRMLCHLWCGHHDEVEVLCVIDRLCQRSFKLHW